MRSADDLVRWYRNDIPAAERLCGEHTDQSGERKATGRERESWEALERELCAAGADPAEIAEGTRRLLARASAPRRPRAQGRKGASVPPRVTARR